MKRFVFAALGILAMTVATASTLRPPAPQVAMVGEGCAWWAANEKPTLTDAGGIAGCVIAQLFAGVAAPIAIAAACVPATITDVTEIIASLINFYEQPEAGTADAGVAVAIWHSSRFGSDVPLHVPSHVEPSVREHLRAAAHAQ